MNNRPEQNNARQTVAEILRVVLVGILAAFLNCTGFRYQSAPLIFSAELLIYLSALCYGPTGFLLSTTLYLGSSFYPAVIFWPALRVSSLALVLFATRRSKDRIPPFFSFSTAWFLLLLLRSYLSWDKELLFPVIDRTHAPLLISLLIEIAAVTILGIFSTSSAASMLLRSPLQEISKSTFFSHILAFPVVIAIAISVLAGESGSLESILTSPPAHIGSLLLLFLVIVLIPTIMAVIVAQWIESCLRAACQVLDPHETLSSTLRRSLLMLDFRNAPQIFHEIGSRLLETKRKLRDLTVTVQALSRKIADYETRSAHHLQALDYGVIALNASGEILAANDSFARILGLSAESLVGTKYLELPTDHIWQAEIVQIIDWSYEHHQLLLKGGSKRLYSSPSEGSYLEITLAALLTAADAAPLDDKSKIPPNLTLTLVLDKRDDLRDFQRETLYADKLALLGISAERMAESYGGELRQISRDCRAATLSLNELFHLAGDDKTKKTARDLSRLLTNFEAKSRQIAAQFEHLRQQAEAKPEQAESMNFTRLLTQGINHLFFLMSIDRRLEPHSISAEAAGDIFILAPVSETYRFLSALLSLIRHILAVSTETAFGLSCEEVEPHTARILGAGAPGLYLRLDISHPGQSISSRSLDSIGQEWQTGEFSLEDVETSLFFLMYVIRCWGGLVSVQSSASKGTNIAIYVPANFAREAKPETAQALANSAESSTTEMFPRCERISVKAGHDSSEAIDDLVSRLGICTRRHDAKDLADHLFSPLAFSGCGFSEPAEVKQNNAGTREIETLTDAVVDMLVFDVRDLDWKSLALITYLETSAPEKPRLVMIEY